MESFRHLAWAKKTQILREWQKIGNDNEIGNDKEEKIGDEKDVQGLEVGVD